MMPEIGPTLCLENDRPEWGLFKGEFRFSSFINQAAVVGEVGGVWIPPRQGYITTITGITVQSGGVSVQVGWRTGNVTFSGGGNTSEFLYTENTRPASGHTFFFGTAAPVDIGFDVIPLIGIAEMGRIAATGGAVFSSPIVLRWLNRPVTQRGLLIRASAANLLFPVTVTGYERPETPNERLV